MKESRCEMLIDEISFPLLHETGVLYLDFSSIPFAFTVSGLAKSSMVISSLFVHALILKVYIHSQNIQCTYIQAYM